MTISLFPTPQNPLPPGAHCRALQTVDGATLRMAHFTPGGAPQGTIALLEGRTEFIEKYFETISDFVVRGFAVATLDWRGQGGSERELSNPRKGHIDDFSYYQRDLSALLAEMARLNCPRPWFALAHSMGGAILLEYAHSGGGAFERLVFSAPMIDIYDLRFPSLYRAVANTLDTLGFGAAFIPGGGPAALDEQPFAGNKLTSDRRRYERNAATLKAAPQIGVGDPTISWSNAAFRQMQRFANPEYPRSLRTPTLIIAAGGDQLVSTKATERFAQQLDIAALITIVGARHEVMMERDAVRAQFFAAVDAFIPGSAVNVGKSEGVG